MNKQVELTEKLAYKILMFFARHLVFQSFRILCIFNKNPTWRLEFYNSSSRARIVKIPNDEIIRFSHKPTCKDIVNELLTCASKGERIASLTSSYHMMTLMRPFATIEELLVKMDLKLSYEQ